MSLKHDKWWHPLYWFYLENRLGIICLFHLSLAAGTVITTHTWPISKVLFGSLFIFSFFVMLRQETSLRPRLKQRWSDEDRRKFSKLGETHKPK